MIKFVLKPGFYEKKRTGKSQPGLDLWRVTLDTLVDRSLAVTTDCCNYYPTAPIIEVVTEGTPSETEMDNANIPLFGMFIAWDGTSGYVLHLRLTASTTLAFSTTT